MKAAGQLLATQESYAEVILFEKGKKIMPELRKELKFPPFQGREEEEEEKKSHSRNISIKLTMTATMKRAKHAN